MNRKKFGLLFLDFALLGIIFLFGTHVVTFTTSQDRILLTPEKNHTPLAKVSPISFLTNLPEVLSAVEPHKVDPEKTVTIPKTQAVLLDLLNTERSSRHLDPLTYDSSLSHIASSYSELMATTNFFSHKDPSGKTPGDRLTENNIIFDTAGENIAYAPDINLAHQNLMHSEEHKANILNAAFKKVGLGIYEASSTKLFVTELFTN